MNRRGFARWAVAAGAGMTSSWACSPERMRRSSGPNLLYIMADDLGYGDLSIYGRKEYETPVLDQFAREGVRLTQGYSAAPVCSPTRVALMTGRYSARVEAGLHEPLTTQPTGLAPVPHTLARVLKDAGYDTALVGKWHLGLLPEYHPMRHGFNEFFGHLGAAVDYVNHMGTEHKEHDLYDGTKHVRVSGYATDLFTDRAVEFISRPRTGPFFLSLQYNAPHWPWQSPGDPEVPDSLLSSRGGNAETFVRMVVSLDTSVGRVLESLSQANLERDTLLIFTSDNGGEKFSYMGPFREKKMTLWEGGIRVAAMVRWPGVIPAGTTSDQVAVTMDWTATLMAAAGASADPRAPLDGIDLLPILAGSNPVTGRELYWRTHQRSRHKAMRSGSWKYLVTEQVSGLFDLATDPSESMDLKGAQPEMYSSLERKYAQWESTMLPPIDLDPAYA